MRKQWIWPNKKEGASYPSKTRSAKPMTERKHSTPKRPLGGASCSRLRCHIKLSSLVLRFPVFDAMSYNSKMVCCLPNSFAMQKTAIPRYNHYKLYANTVRLSRIKDFLSILHVQINPDCIFPKQPPRHTAVSTIFSDHRGVG